MPELTIGNLAPEFRVPALTRQGETIVSLTEQRGKALVLYFYPKDDTPGCTTESCSFRDLQPEFEAAGSTILGISPDDLESHRKFAEKYALLFPLLADPDHVVATQYGVWQEKVNYGRKYWGIVRTTFVIDKEGRVAKIYPRVKVDEHAAKVLAFVKTLGIMAAALLCILSAAGSMARAQGAPPAQIDRTTPHAQNGLTLLAVTRGDAQGQYTFPVPPDLDFLSGPRTNGPAGGIGLWVRGVKPPVTPSQPGRRFSPPFYSNLTAFAAALNGDALPAQVETVSSYAYSSPGSSQAPLFLVTVPGGYPDGYPAIDVSLSDARGHSARWRLVRLAAPYHAITPPVAAHSIFSGAGVHLTARAWRDNGPLQAGIHYDLTGQVPAGSNWIVRIFKQEAEWEAVRPGELEALQASYGPMYARQTQRPALWTVSFGPDDTYSGYSRPNVIQTPYAKYNHFLRLSGELVQMASVSENVTFHNLSIRQSAPPAQFARMHTSYAPPPSYEVVAAPQTVVTPSGLSLSLLPLSALGPQPNRFGGFGPPNDVRMLLRFGQAPPGMSSFQPPSLALPKSPLYKKYHKPVAYFLQAPKPYFLEPSFGFFQRVSDPNIPPQSVMALRLPYAPPIRTMQNGRPTFTMPKANVPKHLDSLTLSVVQRAELRTIPISFVVPISSQAPVQALPPTHRAFFAPARPVKVPFPASPGHR